jgi:mRNA interferase HigB
MRIIAKKAITDFCATNKRKDAPAASKELWAWYALVKQTSWASSADVKAQYRNASVISADRVVFNICGNKYRLVAKVRYRAPGIVWIRFIGTHQQYDRIDAKEV